MGLDSEKLRSIVNDKALDFRQKARYLSLEAENSLDYPAIDAEVQQALDEGVLCDMVEGAAPYKPRYVLPEYSVILLQGSAYLELDPPQDLDEAINCLMIAYHHVPSVTAMPVFVGHLDALLMPFAEGVSDEALHKKIKMLWRFLDRTLPDAFMHANIGPTDNRVARAILRVDAELKQVAPNLTFLYDPAVSTDAILEMATNNIVECSKPHIANHPIHAATFDERGYGIVSCYNALPAAGGASTLSRVSLKEVASRADSVDKFFDDLLPHYLELTFKLIDARIAYLFEESNFFESFIVKEGWIDQNRFTAMFGIYGMAEAVNILQKLQGKVGMYGFDDDANQLGYRISEVMADYVENRPLAHAWRNRALLHSQAGMAWDVGVTPGVRFPYGTEPDPITHIKALQPHHKHYASGVSDILTVDETVKNNPKAMFNLCKGALEMGFREFTANVDSNDLVRVTGYMIRLSDVDTFVECGGSRINTTVLGAQAAKVTGILDRKPRVIGNELSPSYSQ